MLAKNKNYYYDIESTKTVSKHPEDKRVENGHKRKTKEWQEQTGLPAHSGFNKNYETANLRDVWSIATNTYKGAHFATFPTTLIEPCILAGTSEHGVCDKCNSQYERIMAKGEIPERKTRDKTLGVYPDRKTTTRLNSVDMAVIPKTQIGWKQTCDCESSQPVPAVVLDPFFGAGTTGLVAQQHGRNWIGCELNPVYAEMAAKRIKDAEPQPKLFT